MLLRRKQQGRPIRREKSIRIRHLSIQRANRLGKQEAQPCGLIVDAQRIHGTQPSIEGHRMDETNIARDRLSSRQETHSNLRRQRQRNIVCSGGPSITREQVHHPRLPLRKRMRRARCHMPTTSGYEIQHLRYTNQERCPPINNFTTSPPHGVRRDVGGATSTTQRLKKKNVGWISWENPLQGRVPETSTDDLRDPLNQEKNHETKTTISELGSKIPHEDP